MHLDPDELTLLALDALPDVSSRTHIDSCAQCRQELAALRDVVQVGRGTHDIADLPAPPEHVWAAIEREALHPDQAVEEQAVPGHAEPPVSLVEKVAPRRIGAWRTALIAAVAALIGIVGTVIVIGVNRSAPAPVLAVAELAPQNPAAASATGRAELLQGGDGKQLRVTISGMPTPTGYYEAWLYDGTSRMIGLGDIGAGGTVTVNVPSSVDPADFRIVDISAQALGQQEHGQSMLQGRLQDGG